MTGEERIGMPVEAAIDDQRQGAPLVGDSLVHLHDQLLGAINYRRQVGRDDDRTSRTLHALDVDEKLMDALWAVRSAYEVREKRRDREPAAN